MLENNKEIARCFMLDPWNEGHLALIDDLVDPNYVDHNPDPGQPPDAESAEELKRYLVLIRAAMPDLRMTIQDQIAEDDRVVTRWRMTGTHTGSEFLGMPPTGNKVEVTGISIDRVVGGRILEHWSVEDGLSMMRQLGVVP